MQTGKGIYKFINGEKYEGDVNNGIIEGFGKYYFINGDRYEGEFVKGKREGNGNYFIEMETYMKGNLKIMSEKEKEKYF